MERKWWTIFFSWQEMPKLIIDTSLNLSKPGRQVGNWWHHWNSHILKDVLGWDEVVRETQLIFYKCNFSLFQERLSGILEEVVVNTIEQHLPQVSSTELKKWSEHLLLVPAWKPFLSAGSNILIGLRGATSPHYWSMWFECHWVQRWAHGPGLFN